MNKPFIISFITFCICTAFISFSFAEKLYPINDKNGGGYINKNGVIVLEQKYHFAGKFVGNYAVVQDKELKEAVIDKKGNIVIDFEHCDFDNLSENFISYKENGKFGYIDIVKKQKSKLLYDDIKPFKEGFAAVCIDGKWGFINKKGELVIKPQYYNVSNFNQGLAAVSYSRYTTAGYINKKGKMLISFKENNLDPKEFHEGFAPVIKGTDTACSYINKKGKIVIDKDKIHPMESYCNNFYEGVSIFYIYNDNNEVITGFMDKKGRIKYSMDFPIPKNLDKQEFCVFESFSSNMAQITIDYKTGYINRNFELVIPVIYEFARDFDGDLAYVKFEDTEGYINKKGKWVWSKPREGM